MRDFKWLAEPWEHQSNAVEIATTSGRNGYALFWEMGCLSHDTKIKVNRSGLSREVTIEQMYRSFNNVEGDAPNHGWDRTIPTKIRAWKGDHIGLHEIQAVLRSGVKPVYRLKTKRSQIKLTADHEVMTKRGWVKAAELQPGTDEVACDTLTRHQKKKTKAKRKKPRYNLRQVGQYHPYAHETKNRHGKKIRRLEVHRLAYEAYVNDLLVADFIAATKDRDRASTLYFVNPNKYHIHHINHDHKDNRVSNLQQVVASDHNRIHGNYSHFGHGDLSWSSVVSVEYVGPEITYDIVCTDPHRNFVANGMVVHNCGKSFTAINILRVLFMRARCVLRTLVLAPPVVLQNWSREINRFSHCGDDTYVLTGTGKRKLQTFDECAFDTNDSPDGAIVITNYESLLNETLFGAFKQWQPQVIVVDESHYVKNASSKRTKRVTTLAKTAEYRMCLTGTPITNSPMDIFSQFKILDGGESFGTSFTVFRNRYFWDKNAGFKHNAKYFPNWVPNELMLDDMNEKIKHHASILKMEECRDLPDLVKKPVFVELGKEQSRVYRELEKEFVSFVDDKACVATLAMTKAMRLMQIASGFVCLEDEQGERENVPFKEIPRAVALRELLAEITLHSKCIVWAVFKDNYRTIREVCEDVGVKAVEVHGGVPAKAKQAAIDAFNDDPDTKVFIGNSASAGIGCNLTSARYAIFYSRNFSLDQDLQAEKRNHRPGCEDFEHLVRIDLIAQGTIDERIAEKLATKQAISDRVLMEVGRELKERKA